MNAWTPADINSLIVQVVALVGAVTALIVAIQKLRGDVQANTAVTKDVHQAVIDQGTNPPIVVVPPADLPPHG